MQGTLILLGLLAMLQANSQTQPAGDPHLTFEVASVKVAAPGPNGVEGGCHGIDSVYSGRQRQSPPPLGRCVITAARLSHLIGIAYGTSMQALKSGPDWIQRGDLRFDVQAKAEDASKTTEKQLLTMLQNLLIDRFHLQFHYETTEEPGFVLTVAKNGPKLKPSTSEQEQLSFHGPKGESFGKPMGGPTISMSANKFSINMLAEILSRLGSPVVDKTGLTGEYDFTLAWDDENGPVLSSAVRDQLGLTLRPEKIPVSTLIVDSAQKPSEN
jgi:uncharacterized protein (TIGR03435 family)